MSTTIAALNDRLARIENDVKEVRRELEGLLSGPTHSEAWARLAESTFAKDWNNELDAAYNDWRERYGVSR